MKKMLAVALTAAMGCGVLAGCSGGGSTGGAAVQSAQTEAQTAGGAAEGGAAESGAEAPAADPASFEVTEPITIQWWHALEDQYSETVQEVVDDFNSSQDLITVEPVYVGSYAEVNEALVAAHAAGTGLPALTVANTPYVAEYGAGGLTEDLTPYIEATGFEIDDFGKGLVDASSYDGKQVALPFLISTQVMYYNQDMADELGITIPENFADMDAFLEQASVIGADGTTERYGTVVPGWDQWYFETFYLNNGVKIVNDDQVSTDLGSEAAVSLVNKFKEWCDKGWIYWANGTDASSIMRQNFIDGKAFSVIHTSSLYNTYVDLCDFEVGMSWLPGGDTKNQEIGGCVLLIPAKNDQATKNAAWQFLSYLCSKEVNMKWATETGYIPTRNSVLETEEGQQFLAEKPAFQCIFDNLDLIQPRIQHSGWNQLATIWMNYMAEMMIEDVDIPEMIEMMVEEIDEVLADS